MSIPETMMNDRCAGCAFRPGTEASQAPWTVAARDLCVLAGEPFLCHGTGDGHLCRGFVDAFTAKLANGDYDRMPQWRKDLLRKLLDVLDDMRETVERGEPVPDDIVLKALNDFAATADRRNRDDVAATGGGAAEVSGFARVDGGDVEGVRQ